MRDVLERWRRATPPHKQRNHEKNQKHDEGQPRDISRCYRDAAKAENSGNDGNDQKQNEWPTEA